MKPRCAASKARKYLLSVQIRFLSRLIVQKQTAGNLPVDNMKESHITTVERHRRWYEYFLSRNHFPFNL